MMRIFNLGSHHHRFSVCLLTTTQTNICVRRLRKATLESQLMMLACLLAATNQMIVLRPRFCRIRWPVSDRSSVSAHFPHPHVGLILRWPILAQSVRSMKLTQMMTLMMMKMTEREHGVGQGQSVFVRAEIGIRPIWSNFKSF